MGPGVIIQGSRDAAQGLDFLESTKNTNTNPFEKGSVGQIHENFQATQRIEKKKTRTK